MLALAFFAVFGFVIALLACWSAQSAHNHLEALERAYRALHAKLDALNPDVDGSDAFSPEKLDATGREAAK